VTPLPIYLSTYLTIYRSASIYLSLSKILGDANVPRGELTWRSEAGYGYYGAWRMPVQLRLREP
jgi:hypothetical protein